MYENENNTSNYSTYNTGRYDTNGTAYNYGSSYSTQNTEPQKKKGNSIKKAIFSAGLGLLFGAFAGGAFYGVQMGMEYFVPTINEDEREAEELADRVEQDRNWDAIFSQQATGSTVNQITYVQDDVSDVVEEVMPAMVSITNNYTAVSSTMWGNYSQPATSSGSGIIIGETDTELLIVSNNHVVEDADKLEVTFIDGTVAEASIKGLDADMDLGVIAVSLSNISEETRNAITIAQLGDSDQLKLGTPVIAIGNALGFGQSVTTGIVSALDREITYDDGTSGTFIQTDAAINQGNSGGALLNINGEVIGINSSKIGGSMVEGMGYAIPISSASPIVAELMERETKVKVDEADMGYMGITMQNVTTQHEQMFGMPVGVYIYDIESGSPAEQCGLKKGDIIVKFDGVKISTSSDIQEEMQYFAAGDSATLTVKRAANGEYETVEIDITFGKRPTSN